MNISEDVFFNTSFLLANTGFTRPGEKKKKSEGGKGGRQEKKKKKTMGGWTVKRYIFCSSPG